jgi:oxygen-independent coproporphyrinogen-3 oxidase
LNHGLYIHIPFCLKKCAYCDFYSLTDLTLRQPFVDALLQEMVLAQNSEDVTDTLYFGGGTPSVLTRRQIQALYRQAGELFHISSDSEITMEVNPGTISSNDFVILKQIGVNRINIGIQSFTSEMLKFLGRIHNPEQAKKTLEDARQAGFENIGLDLIFGIPGQTRTAWQADLDTALSFSPEHIACYMLSFEPGTLLTEQMQAGTIKAHCEQDLADLFRETQDSLGMAGYEQYEISSYAKVSADGACRRSRHNQKYWSFAPYTGLGPSAHSYRPPSRYWNLRNLRDYLQAISRNRLPLENSEKTSPEQQITEAIYLGLRTADGIDTAKFKEKFNLDFDLALNDTLNMFCHDSLMVQHNGRYALTPKGMLFHESIVSRLLDII